MPDLNQALTEIRTIRRQVAHSTEFRGYGPATLFATAIIAVLAGAAQSHWLPNPAARPAYYVALWLAIGIFCATLILTQALTRANRLHSGMADEMVRIAVARFLPAAIAGLTLPFILLHGPSAIFWMLPGLWQVIFSLGVFASCSSLPRPMLLAGAWFLLTGLALLYLGNVRSLQPISMSAPFAAGMAMVGAIHLCSHKQDIADELPNQDKDR